MTYFLVFKTCHFFVSLFIDTFQLSADTFPDKFKYLTTAAVQVAMNVPSALLEKEVQNLT